LCLLEYTKLKQPKYGRANTDGLYCNKLKSVLLFLDNFHILLATERETNIVILKLVKLAEMLASILFKKN
jgi:hypothetical protein